MKKISVVIPIYYGKSYIPGLIKRIEQNATELDQICKLEIIFVNDSIQDGSIVELAQSDRVDVKVIEHEHNKGIHQTRIDGANASDGDYICFLDQDDQISPVYFKSQLAQIGDASAVICNGKNKSESIYSSTDDFTYKVSRQMMLKGYNYIVSPGQALIRKECIPTAWLQTVMNNNGADDYYLWITFMLENNSLAYNQKILYAHWSSASNTSNDSDQMDRSVIEMAEILYEKEYISENDKLLIISTRKRATGEELETMYSKKQKEAELLQVWLKNEIKGYSVNKYLNNRRISSVSVYGMGNLGRILVDDLLSKGIIVNAIIDKRALPPYKNIPVICPAEKNAVVQNSDLIIVTTLYGYEMIENLLQRSYAIKVVSLEYLLNNMDLELDEV